MKKQVKLSAAQREALTKESIGIVTLGEAQLKLIAGGYTPVSRILNPKDPRFCG